MYNKISIVGGSGSGKSTLCNILSKELNLAYIDDVCNELIKCLNNKETKDGDYCIVPIIYKKTLGVI